MKLNTSLFFLILVVGLLLAELSAVDAATGSRRRSVSRRRSSRRRTSGGSSGGVPKITKDTPITPTKFSSPVILKQATRGSRAKLFTGFAAGYLVTKYVLSEAPVYRGGFPLHGSYVSIPENRAVRLSSKGESLRDSNGDLCLPVPSLSQTQNRTLKDGIEAHLLELNTTVTYKASGKEPAKFHGVNNTVLLEDIEEQEFTVTSRARYNISVVKESEHCTQVEKYIEGTMVHMYETNPDGASTVNINMLLVTSISLLMVISFHSA